MPVPVLLLSLVVDGPHAVAAGFAAFGWQAALSTLYTAGLASLVGYAVFNSLLARNESAYVVPWVLLAPVVAMASAWVLLDQRPSTGEAAGGLLLVLGVLVAIRSRRAPSGTATEPEPVRVAAAP